MCMSVYVCVKRIYVWRERGRADLKKKKKSFEKYREKHMLE